jgi:hypothetical protein
MLFCTHFYRSVLQWAVRPRARRLFAGSSSSSSHGFPLGHITLHTFYLNRILHSRTDLPHNQRQVTRACPPAQKRSWSTSRGLVSPSSLSLSLSTRLYTTSSRPSQIGRTWRPIISGSCSGMFHSLRHFPAGSAPGIAIYPPPNADR